MSIEHVAKLGRSSLLNPSCPPASSDAEHAKKHELVRAQLPTEESGNGVDKLCPPKEARGRE